MNTKPLWLVLGITLIGCRRDDKPPAAPDPAAGKGAEQAPASFMTSGSGFRVRASGTPDGAEVAKLPVGVVVAAVEPVKPGEAWHHVRTPDGQEGWMSSAALVDVDPTHADTVLVAIADKRLATDKKEFAELADLYWALKKTSSTGDVNQAAHLALDRLVALKRALDAIDMESQEKQPYKGFVTQCGDDVFYSEPAGQSFPESAKWWPLVEQYKGTTFGDALAWETAQIPLAGECEGFLGCGLSWDENTTGHYLKLFPRGQHAAEALETYEQIAASSDKADYEDWDGETWGNVFAQLDEATTLVKACNPEQNKKALEALDKTRRALKKMAAKK